MDEPDAGILPQFGTATFTNCVISNVTVAQHHLASEADMDDFLQKVQSHMQKVTHFNIAVSTTESNARDIPIILPKMTAQNLHASKQDIASVPSLATDINPYDATRHEILLHHFHEPYDGNETCHVMIVGEAGAGKTVAAKVYARAVSDGNVEALENVSLVHYVEASSFQSDSPSLPFDLIFSQQIPSLSRSNTFRENVEEWICENSDKVLLVINGLDEFLEPFIGRYPSVNSSTPAKAATIVANILSQKIWPGIRILTTSRFFSWYQQVWPDRFICMEQFDNESLISIMASVLKDDDFVFVSEKILEYDNLRLLCARPLGFISLLIIFSSADAHIPTTLSGLLSSLFMQISNSSHIRNRENLTMFMKQAYDGLRSGRFVFNESELLHFNITDWFLPSGMPMAVTVGTSRWSFSSRVIQEVMAAMYLFQLPLKEVHEFLSTFASEARFELVRLLLYGMIFNPDTSRFIEAHIVNARTPIEQCKHIFKHHLEASIPDGQVSDIKMVVLLNECGREFLARFKHNIEKIVTDDVSLTMAEVSALESVVKNCSPFITVCIGRMKIHMNALEAVVRSCEKADAFIIFSIDVDWFDNPLSKQQHLTLAKLLQYVSHEIKINEWVPASESVTNLEESLNSLSRRKVTVTMKPGSRQVILTPNNKENGTKAINRYQKRKRKLFNMISENPEVQSMASPTKMLRNVASNVQEGGVSGENVQESDLPSTRSSSALPMQHDCGCITKDASGYHNGSNGEVTGIVQRIHGRMKQMWGRFWNQKVTPPSSNPESSSRSTKLCRSNSIKKRMACPVNWRLSDSNGKETDDMGTNPLPVGNLCDQESQMGFSASYHSLNRDGPCTSVMKTTSWSSSILRNVCSVFPNWRNSTSNPESDGKLPNLSQTVEVKTAIFHCKSGSFISRHWVSDESWESVKEDFDSHPKNYEAVQVNPTILIAHKDDDITIQLFEMPYEKGYNINDETTKLIKVQDIVKTGYLDEYFIMQPPLSQLDVNYADIKYTIQVNGNKAHKIPFRLTGVEDTPKCPKDEEKNSPQNVFNIVEKQVQALNHTDSCEAFQPKNNNPDCNFPKY